MAKKIPNWLLGCGIGCGAVLVILIALGVGGAVFISETVSGFEDAVEARQVLDEAYGKIGDFTPPANGAIPHSRMGVFLTVREFTMPQRDRLAEVFGNLPLNPDEARELENKPFSEKLGSILRITTSAMGLGARIGDFFAARNKAMLQEQIGFGEYVYIYTLAYYSWLKHSPEEGPGEDEGRSDFQFGRGNRDLHDYLLKMLRNQLTALPIESEAGWEEALQREIEAMESDSRRLPWQDGLPTPLEASLQPYRDRLEATYNPATNPFELVRNRKRGSFSYTIE